MTDSVGANPFIEQAEYLDPADFKAWSAEHPDEHTILRKLSQSGAKLIIGPRGSGKTTLLLKAYNSMLRSAGGGALPVYVNFKSSLKLEPLYRVNANAVYWFNQWLLLKVYQGLWSTLSELEASDRCALKYTKDEVDRLAGRLELGDVFSITDAFEGVDVPTFEEDIRRTLSETGRTRCVLLLDDAAHAFSPEQQRDFFDFFRQVKSRSVSPKAAIYPGVTTYSSTFHVGHDAEEVDIWVKPQSPSYLHFMMSLLERRLPSDVYRSFAQDDSLLKLVCLASFGMPRSLLNTIRTFYKEDPEAEGSFDTSFTRATALKAITGVVDNSLAVYRSLKIKLPMYSAFISTGDGLYARMLEALKQYNRDKPVDRQSVTIAIQRPIPAELKKVLGFFQYSGLLLPSGEVSRGEKGVFELYVLHYAALIDRNVLLGRKALNVSDYVLAFEKRHAHEFTRLNVSTLLAGMDIAEAFSLSLPPCQVCQTPRINESAKFCLNCGSQLKSVSTFEAVVSADIEELPLTDVRVSRIKEHSNIRKVKDILMDHENRELRKVPRVGPYWAGRIYAYAEEFIA